MVPYLLKRFTALKADQDINKGFALSSCPNGTFDELIILNPNKGLPNF